MCTYICDASVRHYVTLFYHDYLFSAGFSFTYGILQAKKQTFHSSNFKASEMPGTQEAPNRCFWMNNVSHWTQYTNFHFLKQPKE